VRSFRTGVTDGSLATGQFNMCNCTRRRGLSSPRATLPSGPPEGPFTGVPPALPSVRQGCSQTAPAGGDRRARARHGHGVNAGKGPETGPGDKRDDEGEKKIAPDPAESGAIDDAPCDGVSLCSCQSDEGEGPVGAEPASLELSHGCSACWGTCRSPAVQAIQASLRCCGMPASRARTSASR
jgi:hypothetical protein